MDVAVLGAHAPPSKVNKPRRQKRSSSTFAKPVPKGVSTGQDFDKKVDSHEPNGNCLMEEKKCKYCNGKRSKPLYMTTKEHEHPARATNGNPKRGLQLKFNKYKNFTTRCCTPRSLGLHKLILYVQGRAGYKSAKNQEVLTVSKEDALRAKSHLVGYGYRVIDYEQWAKTWPIKAAACPGMQGRGGSRNKDSDEQVAQWVRDFFDLGSTKKRRVNKLTSQSLPQVMSNLYDKVENELGLHISNSHFHELSKVSKFKEC